MDRAGSGASVSHSVRYAVAVPVYRAADKVRLCLESIDACTPAEVELLVVDDGSGDAAVDELLETFRSSVGRPLTVRRRAENLGFVDTANELFGMAGERDVILVNSDVIVTPGWADALSRVAATDASAATVTAASNHGTIASLTDLTRTVDWRDVVAGKYTSGEGRIALLPTAVGHCIYVRRSALDLVGGFDSAFGRGYGEEVDFSQRCLAVGLRHLLATGVFVYHFGSASFPEGPETERARQQGDREVETRHPSYMTQLELVQRQVLPGGLESGRISGLRQWLVTSRGLLLGLDYRMVGIEATGTATLVTELARALCRDERVTGLTVYVDRDNPSWLMKPSSFLVGDDVTVRAVVPGEVPAQHECDVFIRPSQFSRESELAVALAVAPRWHLHILDGIAFDNPAYWTSLDDWRSYRDLQQRSVALADSVSALSDAVGTWMVAAGLSDQQPRTIYCGIPERTDSGALPEPAPGSTLRLLHYGAAFLHKNRVFSVAVAEELCRRGQDVELVLAGPDPITGSSRARELEALERTQERLRAAGRTAGQLRARRLPFLSDAELEALVRASDCVLYPSTVEGFGMVPFESAGWSTPALAADTGSLREVLPGNVLVEGFSPLRWADRVQELRAKPEVAALNVDSMLSRASEFTWDRMADGFVAEALHALRSTRTSAGVAQGSHLSHGPGSTIWPEGVPPLDELLRDRAALQAICSSRRWGLVNRTLRALGR